jgi:DNA-binding transcriptional regulator/RsmH inhibitor MraZ
VSSTYQRYKGFKPAKMDPKFRVSVQPSWRPEAGSSLFLLFSKEHDMPVVKVLSQEAYDRKSRTDPRQRQDARREGQDARQAGDALPRGEPQRAGQAAGSQGPQRKGRGIAADSDVMLAGRGIHFEIWSKTNFDKVLEIEMAQEEDDELGIF